MMTKMFSLINMYQTHQPRSSIPRSLALLPNSTTYIYRSSCSISQLPSTMPESLIAQLYAQAHPKAAAAAANLDPITCIPASQRDNIRAQVVTAIHAACHPVTATSGNGQT